jgi:hypothetical protein
MKSSPGSFADWFRKISELASRSPLTARGVVFLAAGLLVADWGYAERDSVYWGWSLAFLVLGAMTAILTSLGWIALLRTEKGMDSTKFRRHLHANGNWVETGLEIPSILKYLPVRVTCEWLSPKLSEHGGESILLDGKEMVRFERRGFLEQIVREFILSDHLGLFRFRRRWKTDAVVRIMPAKTREPPDIRQMKASGMGETQHPEGEDTGDYLDLRQYREGDPVRYMLWKIWARTGGQRKYVRTPETILDPGFAIFLFPGALDEANARLVKRLVEEQSEWLLGVVAKPANYRGKGGFELRRTQDRKKTPELLARSGVDSEHLKTRDVLSRYDEFQSLAHRMRIGLCLTFFPPGGERQFSAKKLRSRCHVASQSFIVGYFKDKEEEGRKANETEKHFRRMRNVKPMKMGIAFPVRSRHG